MVSPIAAARPFPAAGAARHGVRAGTNLLPRRFLRSGAPGARPPPRDPARRAEASVRKAASCEDARGFGAGRSLSARPAWQWVAGTSGCSWRAPRGAPPGRRRLGSRAPGARAPRGALGGSEPAHGHLHGPFAARSQPVTPRGQGPTARRARTARPEPPGLAALPGSPRPAPLLRLSPFHGFLEKTGRLRRARPCRENL